MRYQLSKQAERDLESIFVQGIERFGEHQAMRYQDSFCRTFELLASIPTIGRTSERQAIGERRFVHGSHVIYYRIESNRIIIQSIIYGPRILDIWGES